MYVSWHIKWIYISAVHMISYVLFSETAEKNPRVTRYNPWPSNESAEEGRLLASDTVKKPSTYTPVFLVGFSWR